MPEDLSYTDQHEWVRIDGETATVGITEYAVTQLGDVVYVELPEIGTALAAGDVIGEIESTKSVSEIYAPLAGTVEHVNSELTDAPELVNAEPYGRGWIVKLAATGSEGLLSPAEYAELVAE
ncbi:glycine cleavage system protein GcvH [Propionicicella superfundia]|uniref:glycine cleavage system protein GcvH n=1 Tax=Propionicicella superfundia TaxID=348582 RepID=UPI003CCC3839